MLTNLNIKVYSISIRLVAPEGRRQNNIYYVSFLIFLYTHMAI